MTRKIKVAVVGLGKMGLSHFSIVNAHPQVECVACDATGFLIDVLGKNVKNKLYKSYDKMLEEETLDAVVIATPSRHHATMVRAALDRGIHVFCEKPFCLDWREGDALAQLAEEKGLIGQVGYHYRYVGAFREMQRILETGALGTVHHVLAEAYGPVVLRPKRQTWRTQKAEGGGCLYDYAAHPLNLLNWVFGAPQVVSGSSLNSIFSTGTDDAVISSLKFPGGASAQLSVNWSDESHRKMSTKLSFIGTNGRMNVDRQECQIYLRKASDAFPDYKEGWSVRYTTDLTEDPWFYLRGEEYSAQIADFVEAVAAGETTARENGFRSAAMTDQTISMIVDDAGRPGSAAVTPAPAVVATKDSGGRGWRSLFGR